MMPMPPSIRCAVLLAAGTMAIHAVAAQVPAKRPAPAVKRAEPAPKTASPKTDTAQPHFDSAQTYQLAGDFDRASKEYRRAIAIGLDHLGNLRAARQDYSGAKQLLGQAIAMNPDDQDPTVDLAIAKLYSGDLKEAETDAKAVLQKNPDHFRARALLGKIDFLQGNYEAAAEELKTALGLATDFDVAYNLALADLELKKTSLAIVLFDE